VRAEVAESYCPEAQPCSLLRWSLERRGHRPDDVVGLGAVPSNQAKGFGYPDSKSGHRGEAATVILAAYIRLSNVCKDTWISFSQKAFKELRQFTDLAMPSAMMIWSVYSVWSRGGQEPGLGLGSVLAARGGRQQAPGHMEMVACGESRRELSLRETMGERGVGGQGASKMVGRTRAMCVAAGQKEWG
jgi:hypothetical protein